MKITPFCVGFLKQKSGRKFFILSSYISFQKEIKTVYIININYMSFILLLSCTDFIILRKNPTNALKYVNADLFTLLDCYMFQPKWVILKRLLIDFVSRVSKIRVQMSYLYLNPYFVDPANEMYRYSLRIPPCRLQNVGM